ncbi:hypothetical protein [Cesiribacter andamanensis]|uniref:Uncharacterized protein n=1 Tax=Cesiribacter andamanensis AMV16 TaxID=1279009 RepID=M7N2C0_9BACT|nr:hypothetical protein [Cesiribacter andamanensis]EMR01457.1 hypothetical protein ADICEAN_03413 [Cesiribacter andamanensis AMV16]
MKQYSKLLVASLQGLQARILLTLSLLFSSLLSIAQDGGLDVDIDVNDEPMWYESIWLWVGLAVFIIIIVAIVSAGRKR